MGVEERLAAPVRIARRRIGSAAFVGRAPSLARAVNRSSPPHWPGVPQHPVRSTAASPSLTSLVGRSRAGRCRDSTASAVPELDISRYGWSTALLAAEDAEVADRASVLIGLFDPGLPVAVVPVRDQDNRSGAGWRPGFRQHNPDGWLRLRPAEPPLLRSGAIRRHPDIVVGGHQGLALEPRPVQGANPASFARRRPGVRPGTRTYRPLQMYRAIAPLQAAARCAESGPPPRRQDALGASPSITTYEWAVGLRSGNQNAAAGRACASHAPTAGGSASAASDRGASRTANANAA
jgi:hypothetical protein